MSEFAVRLAHSVDANVSLRFAWAYRTDVTRWTDPPATFTLDGPFASGSRGSTILPEQSPLHWFLCDVRPEQSFVVEMPLDDATLHFEWLFEPLAERTTRLTQRITLFGMNAKAYEQEVKRAFGANLPTAMQRIAAVMEADETMANGAVPRVEAKDK